MIACAITLNDLKSACEYGISYIEPMCKCFRGIFNEHKNIGTKSFFSKKHFPENL